MIKPEIDKNGNIHFSDYPDFKPNLTPQKIFELGSFGGTYWRPIYSSITKKNYKNEHLKFPKEWWKKIDDYMLISEKYNSKINKYKIFCGSSLKEWERSGWIKKYDPYGWVQWYCNFFLGRRGKTIDEIEYDKYQISRWLKLASEKGRFRRQLINKIKKNNTTYDDFSISPRIRQSLQHWGYKLTKEDLRIT